MAETRQNGGALETVDGTVRSVVFRNDETGFTVLHVALADDGRFRLAEQVVTVLGACAAAWEGEELHATGEWVNDPARGRQFKAKTMECIPPKSAEGIRRYLASGLIRGIGPVLANRIVDRFGVDTIDVLDHHSGRLQEIPKVGPKKIEAVVKGWREGRATREIMIFTQTYGISVAKTTKIYKKYGPDSVAIIKKDPYRLCRDIWGIGFSTADKIAMSVGMPKDSPLRARAAVVHTLRTEADDGGHCWTSEPDLLLHAQELVGISVEILAEALKAEIDDGRVVKEDERIYLRDLWSAERRVAAKLKDLLGAQPGFQPIDAGKAVAWWEKKTGFTLAPAQLQAVRTSLGSKVSIVTGGPGVGKTTIIRALVEIYGARKGEHALRILQAAPTGRAAKRMTESTGAPAQTLHRLLKYNPQTNEFTYNAENPLPGDVFIFDETSMVDIRLMADLVAALPRTAVLILVGDTDQLPSVGPGNVLHDLIRSGTVPTSQLTQIFRQDSSGLIVRNAHHVNAGEPFETRQGESDFYFIPQEDPQKALAYALDFMTTRIPRHFRMEPLQDVQVLTPMRRNLLGAENLNAVIQQQLNGSGPSIARGGTLFRGGDRVMQLRNNYDKDVFNGDVGFVQSVDTGERSLVVLFDGRPVEYRAGDLDELTLAYATTIHKSQGSEYPAVIVLLHRQHYMMLQRNLLYTAITRGKKLVLVIGAAWAVKQAIETNTVRERRTSLAERLAMECTTFSPPQTTPAGRTRIPSIL
ncbi:MAG: ATP-dependent RecD-like DNA helicase [Kiritimatiellae bacterium]|nr:ATP-dependent RecD-like DNA helicase [Kiritimatiellia bacterium]